MARRQSMEVTGSRLDANDAALALSDQGGVGPFGNLNEGNVASIRNDLPFADGYEPTDEDRLRALLSEVGSDGQAGLVSIWKLNPNTKKMEFVDRRATSDFEANGLPYLAQTFGAGEYELRIYGPNSKLVARPRVTISEAAARISSTPANGSANSEIAMLARTMQEGFAMLARQQQQQQPPAESRSQILQELMQMKQIFGGDRPAGPDPITMFTQMAGIVKSMQPRGEGESNLFVELLDRFSPMLLESMQAAKENAPAVSVAGQLPATVAAPARAQQPQQPQQQRPQPSPEQQGANAMSFQLKMQLNYLCAQAAKDADPGPWAAIIIDNAPKEALDALVNDANWLEALAAFVPRVKQFPEWFGELHDAIIEEMQNKENLTPEPDEDIQQGITGQGAINVSGSGSGSDEIEA